MKRITPSQSPLLQILSVAGSIMLIAVATLLGAVVLAALLGFAAIAITIFSLRVWLIRRQLRRQGATGTPDQGVGAGDSGRVIEGEYRKEETHHRRQR